MTTTSRPSRQPQVGDIVLVGQSKHPRRVTAVRDGRVSLERVDGRSDGCWQAPVESCRVLEAHPGGAR